MKPHLDDENFYKAKCLGRYHNKGDVKTRKNWNHFYMIDVKEHSDFESIMRE